MEHHANLVPWQEVCDKTGAVLRWRHRFLFVALIVSGLVIGVAAVIAQGILGPQTYVERVASTERSAQLAAPMIAGEVQPHV